MSFEEEFAVLRIEQLSRNITALKLSEGMNSNNKSKFTAGL